MRKVPVLTLVVATVLAPLAARAQPPAPPPPDEAHKAEAIDHFNAGMAHFKQQDWAAALSEFLKSRELYPSRAATKNAAYCLRKENRLDESLDMYEALLRNFPDLAPDERQFALDAIRELEPLVGTIDVQGAEPGASIVVDGRDRGTFPLGHPLRASAGQPHTVFVYKEGFLPFEARVDVVAGRPSVVRAHLGALTRGGRLRVSEVSGKTLEVSVDGAVVGRTPWEGTLAVGPHVIALRGEGDLGTQPAQANVRLDQVTPITLVAEPLEASARVEPTPVGANVAVDGVSVGHGVWEGKLRVGAHRIEVAQEGFLTFARQISLARGERRVITAALDRDPNSPLWAAAHPPRFVLELTGAGVAGPLYGGDVLSGCSGSCSAALPLGGLGMLHAAYQLRSGIGFGADVGYLYVGTKASGRSVSATPFGLATANTGTVDDSLSLRGLTVGGHLSYHFGDDWPVTLRLGVGALLATASDERNGTLTNSQGQAYGVDVTERPSATYLYVGPEVRVARRLGSHFEASVGLSVIALTALGTPAWQDLNPPLSAPNPSQSAGDGIVFFGRQTITGSALLLVAPGVGLRYDF